MTIRAKRVLNVLQTRTVKLKKQMDVCKYELKKRTDNPKNGGSSSSSGNVEFYGTEDNRLSEMKKRSEEKLAEIKRQSQMEIQKAELKASEMVQREREKFEEILKETKKSLFLAAATAVQRDNLQTVLQNIFYLLFFPIYNLVS